MVASETFLAGFSIRCIKPAFLFSFTVLTGVKDIAFKAFSALIVNHIISYALWILEKAITVVVQQGRMGALTLASSVGVTTERKLLDANKVRVKNILKVASSTYIEIKIDDVAMNVPVLDSLKTSPTNSH